MFSPFFFSLTKVGLSLAQIGEFAFVLLSRASHLHLIGVNYSHLIHKFSFKLLCIASMMPSSTKFFCVGENVSVITGNNCS
jgi:predicted Kef-type K+ transport protein